MGHKQGRLFPILVVGLVSCVLVALAAACGSTATPEPTAESAEAVILAIDLKTSLRNAVNELLLLESVAFSLEHLSGTTAIIPGFLEMTKASGLVDIPDKFSLKVESETLTPKSYVEIDVIMISDQAYMTDFITGQWREVDPEILPFNVSNLGVKLADIIEAVEDPLLEGSERVRGFETYHIAGGIMSEDLASLVPGAGEGLSVRLDLWLEQASNLLLEVLITGVVITTDEIGTVRRLTLDDINVPVEILPPE